MISIEKKKKRSRMMQLLLLHLLSFYLCLQIINSQPWTPDLWKLLNRHNELRHQLMNCQVPGQPPARYLPDLKWDNTLASHAQRIADKCVFGHENVKVDDYYYVGQNIAGYQTVDLAISAWWDEYKDYSYNAKYCRGVCGHYLQMAWENTTHIGCGIRDCKGTSFEYGLSVVCHYGEGGNYPNRHPYRTKPTSECGRRPGPVKTTPRPTVIKTTRKPPVTKKPPKPDWTKLVSSWSQYVTTQHLQGTVTQTCICIN